MFIINKFKKMVLKIPRMKERNSEMVLVKLMLINLFISINISLMAWYS